VPSPAFNRDDSRLRDVHPLQPFRQQPEMDHSFVGMTGGQIFHEMMLRHGVKHVCTFVTQISTREIFALFEQDQC
jgi:acetolactate synthase-1/2/3 large subunit